MPPPLDSPEDPDGELIRAFPPPAPAHSSKSALLARTHLAFSSIDSSLHREERKHAGTSSAAACIALELPTMAGGGSSSRKKKKPPSVELMSKNNKRRSDPVSDKEVRRWREGSQKACHRFKPVYTHQFFDDERVRGYRPTDAALLEAQVASQMAGENSNSQEHPSFSQHAIAGHSLSIQVRLAPSCRKSIVVVEVEKVAQLKSGDVDGEATEQKSKKLDGEATNALLRKVSATSFQWDGDNEEDGDEYQLKNSAGRKRKRGGLPVKSPVPEIAPERRSRLLRSGRKRIHAVRPGRRLPRVEELSVPATKSRGSRGKTIEMKQVPELVTDVSDEEAEGPSASVQMGDQAKQHKGGKPPADLAPVKVGTVINQVCGGLPNVEAVLLKDESATDGGSGYKVLSCHAQSIADIENDYLDAPFGRAIKEYSRGNASADIASAAAENGTSPATKGEFLLTLADMRNDKDARQYHDEVEKMSLWFIEIASPVEVGIRGGVETDGSYWKVLYLFQKHSSGSATKYSLVGYLTLLYHGLKMTVCQAVCLPPFQRAGHGSEMLMAAYDVCEDREILVESPAPVFVALRNRVDFGLLGSLMERTRIVPRKFKDVCQVLESESSLPDDVLGKAASKLNITPRQVSIAYQIWLLAQLENSIRATANRSQSVAAANLEAGYKTIVKRSLLKALRECSETNFDAMPKAKQGEHLERCFNAAIVRYRSILK
ncbi:hypothetical protein ACHAXT_007392 [Thalassiosira profunda]